MIHISAVKTSTAAWLNIYAKTWKINWKSTSAVTRRPWEDFEPNASLWSDSCQQLMRLSLSTISATMTMRNPSQGVSSSHFVRTYSRNAQWHWIRSLKMPSLTSIKLTRSLWLVVRLVSQKWEKSSRATLKANNSMTRWIQTRLLLMERLSNQPS